MKSEKKNLEKAAAYLAKAQYICLLTGAGISAESGLKTFRDAGGLWETHPIEKVATPEGFAEDPKLVWEFYNARRKAADTAVPNAAHIALARLEMGRKRKTKKSKSSNGNGTGHHAPEPLTILTQNIDGLHQQAGSQTVVELHGSIWKVRCTGCGVVSRDFPVELPLLPRCGECGSLLRPHVVWFGEQLFAEDLEAADAAIEACDLFVVIGTSAVVQPAASYPFIAARRGVPVVEINKEKTPVSAIAELSLMGLAGEILPLIIPD
jgi:NAD-dependent protein deacetylase/lipoamidase